MASWTTLTPKPAKDGTSEHFIAGYGVNGAVGLFIYLPCTLYYMIKLFEYRNYSIMRKRYVKLTFHQLSWIILLQVFVVSICLTCFISDLAQYDLSPAIWIVGPCLGPLLGCSCLWMTVWRFWHVCKLYISWFCSFFFLKQAQLQTQTMLTSNQNHSQFTLNSLL